MAYLILIRHGQSEWNKKGLWTGFTDISLNDKGKDEAKKAAFAIKGVKIDLAFTSVLKRAKETLDIILDTLGIQYIPIHEDFALNERDYGKLTGKNKWEIKKIYGDEQFQNIRRGWDYPIPEGETLKDVYNRAVPYYQKKILPQLKNGKNCLIVAHGNSLRALVKYLEKIDDAKIASLEIGTGDVYVYQIDQEDNIIAKEIRSTNSIHV